MTDPQSNRPPPKAPPRRARLGSRAVLVAGFAGLLVLMTTAGVDSLRVLQQIEASNAIIQRHYLSRERTLGQITEALYQSGSVVRDYILLNPGEKTSEMLRAELKTIRGVMEAALQDYARSLRPEESEAFQRLTDEINRYWAVLNPIFEWSENDKDDFGYWFLRKELFPRRTTVLAIARNIAAVNDETLKEGEKRVSQVFAQFRRRMQMFGAIGLGLGLTVAALSILYIVWLERAADQRYRESLRAQDELKRLSGRLVDAQEQERRAISRELHDEVGQSLSALLMDIGNLAAAVPGAGGEFRHRLENIKKLAENAVDSVRNMALLLRPSMLDDLGLVPALEWQAREVRKRTGLLVELIDENVSDALPEDYKTCVYRLVQEALHNCARHARARSARIVVRQEPDRLLLTIQDDGQGFDARRVQGLGLIGMSERVAHLGGTFQVDSAPGRGALLRAELPLAPQPQEVAS